MYIYKYHFYCYSIKDIILCYLQMRVRTGKIRRPHEKKIKL